MKCPKCGYDLFSTYQEVLYEGKNSKCCEIVDFRLEVTPDVISGHSWSIKCKCPKCRTKWVTTDSDY